MNSAQDALQGWIMLLFSFSCWARFCRYDNIVCYICFLAILFKAHLRTQLKSLRIYATAYAITDVLLFGSVYADIMRKHILPRPGATVAYRLHTDVTDYAATNEMLSP